MVNPPTGSHKGGVGRTYTRTALGAQQQPDDREAMLRNIAGMRGMTEEELRARDIRQAPLLVNAYPQLGDDDPVDTAAHKPTFAGALFLGLAVAAVLWALGYATVCWALGVIGGAL